MPWFELIWEWDEDDGNVAHIAEHDLTPDDVEYAIANSIETGTSRSSGRPIIFGYTEDGRRVAVVYESIDEVTLYPITAFEVE